MKITIKAFASVSEICGFRVKEVVVAEGISVEEVAQRLMASFDGLARISDTLLFAVNEEYCDKGRALADGDVLALFPPVSGG
jgi:sulfur-carrier protein